MLENRRSFDSRGVPILYCGSPKIPDYAQFMPNPPPVCAPIFVELYTVPVPNHRPLFLTPLGIEPIVQGAAE